MLTDPYPHVDPLVVMNQSRWAIPGGDNPDDLHPLAPHNRNVYELARVKAMRPSFRLWCRERDIADACRKINGLAAELRGNVSAAREAVAQIRRAVATGSQT